MTKTNNTYKGIVLLLLSAIFFAISSAFGKIVTVNTNLSGSILAFSRFFIGFILACTYVVVKKKSLRPNNVKWVSLRAVLNTFTIILFFYGIQLTTITNANMLNMTYPVFVFLIAPKINGEKIPKIYYLFLSLTIIGYYLVVVPDFNSINIGDVIALISGLIAAFAITSLREARKYDESYLIVFYLMGFGSLMSFFTALPSFETVSISYMYYIIISGLLGAVGQLFITAGYRYVDAATGSLVSASRIIFSVIIGASFFADPLGLRIIIGGILIMSSLIGVNRISMIRDSK